MSFFLKIAFYGMLGLSGLVSSFYWIVSLFDVIGGTKRQEASFLLLAASVCLAFLYKAYKTGHEQGQFGLGLALAAGGVVALLVIYLGCMFAFGDMRWQ